MKTKSLSLKHSPHAEPSCTPTGRVLCKRLAGLQMPGIGHGAFPRLSASRARTPAASPSSVLHTHAGAFLRRPTPAEDTRDGHQTSEERAWAEASIRDHRAKGKQTRLRPQLLLRPQSSEADTGPPGLHWVTGKGASLREPEPYSCPDAFTARPQPLPWLSASVFSVLMLHFRQAAGPDWHVKCVHCPVTGNRRCRVPAKASTLSIRGGFCPSELPRRFPQDCVGCGEDLAAGVRPAGYGGPRCWAPGHEKGTGDGEGVGEVKEEEEEGRQRARSRTGREERRREEEEEEEEEEDDDEEEEDEDEDEDEEEEEEEESYGEGREEEGRALSPASIFNTTVHQAQRRAATTVSPAEVRDQGTNTSPLRPLPNPPPR
ncbi:hypothetical protein H920_12040 [Fukomys damarensis]|uniref:Uncharacterized protein n=1 Tax=Fukomys damarensis TaxID=885580 RepID=A0A091DV38_FUKDA|nr:hypothetical protein H920_12040 [Fukomys damarensis]